MRFYGLGTDEIVHSLAPCDLIDTVCSTLNSSFTTRWSFSDAKSQKEVRRF